MYKFYTKEKREADGEQERRNKCSILLFMGQRWEEPKKIRLFQSFFENPTPSSFIPFQG